MSTANLVTVFAFVAVLVLVLFASSFRDVYKNRPKNRIKNRLFRVTHHARTRTSSKSMQQLRRAQTDARRRRLRQSFGWLGYYLNRLDTIAGANAARLLGLLAAGVFGLGLFLMGIGFFPRSLWMVPIVGGFPFVSIVLAYRFLVQRFYKRFIGQLPDAMDFIVRASQAGVPVSQSIRDVGARFQAPLGPEFRRMGDALLLGHDIEEVLDEAAVRIELPDFTFFTVCVLLQRESGGSIVEALENLSTIIRSRRDIALKARALTAEGRLSGVFIAAIPFIIMGMMYSLNPDYIMVLFTTDTGRTMLWAAAGPGRGATSGP